MSTNQNQANIDSLLDASIDDLDDLPEFAVYPAGVHRVVVKFSTKAINENPAVEMAMSAVETVELVNSDETPLAAGAESSVLFMLNNEFGQGKLKQIMKPLAAQFGTTSIKETMEAANEAEVIVTTKVRQNKDKSQSYTDVTKIAFE